MLRHGYGIYQLPPMNARGSMRGAADPGRGLAGELNECTGRARSGVQGTGIKKE